MGIVDNERKPEVNVGCDLFGANQYNRSPVSRDQYAPFAFAPFDRLTHLLMTDREW